MWIQIGLFSQKVMNIQIICFNTLMFCQFNNYLREILIMREIIMREILIIWNTWIFKIYSPTTRTILCTSVIGNSWVHHWNTGVIITVSIATVTPCCVGTTVIYRSGTPGIIIISADDPIFSIIGHGNTNPAGDSRYSSICQCVSTDSIEEC